MTVAEYALCGSYLNARDLRQSLNELQNRLFSSMTDRDADIIQRFHESSELNNPNDEMVQICGAATAIPTIESAEMTIENASNLESKPVIFNETNDADRTNGTNGTNDNSVTKSTKLSSSLERKKLIISSQRARQNITFIKRVITATTKVSNTTHSVKARSVNSTKLVIDTSDSANSNNTKKLGGKMSPEHIEKLIGKEVTTPRKIVATSLSTPTMKRTAVAATSTPMTKTNYTTTTPSKTLLTATNTPIASKGLSRTPRPSKDPTDKYVKPSGLPNKLLLDMPPPAAKPTKNIAKLSFDSAIKKQQAGEESKALRQSAPMESAKLFGLINSKSAMAMTPIKSIAETVSANEENISPKRVAENPFMSLMTPQNNH